MFKSILILAIVGVCLGQFGGRKFPFQPRPQVRTQTQFQSPRPFQPVIRLLRSDVDGPHSDGSYKISFASEDGISREERGRLKAPETMEVTGSYSYTSPEGVRVDVTYVADEFGFRAESPNLPVGPPIPEHSLAQIRASEAARRNPSFRAGQPSPGRFRN